jgi:hypothetical protein
MIENSMDRVAQAEKFGKPIASDQWAQRRGKLYLFRQYKIGWFRAYKRILIDEMIARQVSLTTHHVNIQGTRQLINWLPE